MQAILGEQRTNVIAIRNAVSGNADRELIDEIVKVSDAYEKDATDYVTLCADQEVSRQKAADGGSLTSKTATAVSDAAAAKMSSLMGSTILFVIIIIIVAILIGILMAVIITRSITGAMRKGVDFAQLVAGGDLSARLDIDQNDEIGLLAKALQDMLARLTKIVEEVNSAARQVAAGSQQLSSTSQQMSQGATEQAASVEEISSSMEEMTSNIKQNADNALQTEGIARKSALAAEEGGRAVSATVAAMKEIASKIGIIEEIARSTNMLALNASIEAARAGEYGKGFAVVASEVGKLAERSQKEAGEISVERVNIADQAGNTIDAMIPDIKRTAELVQEISAASNEQNSGAEQINSAILQLDQVVQQNASASEESASMSEELASQADQMQGTMAFFKLGTDRKSATVAPTLPRSETVRSGSALNERASSEGKPREIVSSAKKVLPKTELPKNTEQTPPGEKNTVSKSTEVPRKPLSGIRIMLDDDSSLAGRDSMDKDFQEF
jgi:methyl-accepting chemotaxis protein